MSGQFDECEFLVQNVLVASSVVMGVDIVLIIGVFVDVRENYVLAVLIYWSDCRRLDSWERT